MTTVVGLMPGVRYESLYFAGGCFYSLWVGETPNDYDIFARTPEAAAALSAWADDHADRVDQRSKWAFRVGKLNFVTAVHGKPSVVTGGFDFAHTQAWWSTGARGPGSVFGTGFDRMIEIWNRKRLIPNTDGCANIAQWRVEKFLKKGWELDGGELDSFLLLAGVAAADPGLNPDDYDALSTPVAAVNPNAVQSLVFLYNGDTQHNV
jgi:hypothetical protein